MTAKGNNLSSGSNYRILIADDHPVVRRGVRQILTEYFPTLVLGEVTSGEAVLEANRGEHWDLLILDIGLHGRSGIDILPDLRRLAPSLPVLVLTMHAEDQFALRLFRAGIAGYLNKESAPDELVEAVRKIQAGGKYVSPGMAERMALSLDPARQLPNETLSDREFQVMRWLAGGMSVAQIAAVLGLHVRTVGTFRRHVLRKLNLKTTQELAYYGIRGGFVDWPEGK